MTEYQDYLSWTYFGSNAFDQEEFDRLSDILQGTEMFIDVGASHGVYTFHANNILNNAKIIAIEADPTRYKILKENAAEWTKASSNEIICVNAAVSDQHDRELNPQITFYKTDTQISGGLFKVQERSDDYDAIPVEVICIDDFYNDSERTFIKIDVEGSELRVLQGALRHIQNKATKIFVEVSWWGDRARHTTPLHVLRFCYVNRLKMERRLRSDYLLTYEVNRVILVTSLFRCFFPLAIRTLYNGLLPSQIRQWRERRLNARRLMRYEKS